MRIITFFVTGWGKQMHRDPTVTRVLAQTRGVFGTGQRVMMLFYHAVIEIVLHYGISARFGETSAQIKKIDRLVLG